MAGICKACYERLKIKIMIPVPYLLADYVTAIFVQSEKFNDARALSQSRLGN
jgi:hypothetical protein